MKTIIEFGKYSGYKVKCPCCKTKFITSFDELEVGFLTGGHFTYCPCCHKTVWKTLFWRKTK